MPVARFRDFQHVSTHSRLKAAGVACCTFPRFPACFDTQPPEGGWVAEIADLADKAKFQHTAA